MKECNKYSEMIHPLTVIPFMIMAGVSSIIYGIFSVNKMLKEGHKDRTHIMSGARFILLGVMLLRLPTAGYLLLYKIYETLVDIRNVLTARNS
ncbi:MAG: hypothetical protein DKM50_07460 [Candidatus Margulisiibacteriota bacterium]|nr:MAG: hypothetical protein A2X43_05975 [Candidatus Margulisbacteria bacterium GWD2_39_127]OGI02673.1 MAG: hypothetical protein A2X42_00310 [Candidatus Margulisbacteria bacterium GWF2_38_17]OGI05942.1 MAG: hypothetical protein A2X41_07675 [Candidatus Margulisbacteria bacterium GWE2_39_32]PZM80004.1 MAG: hypothetical protein DKM50_07460 [Candidatus Margulisiibacteriota bacterium]HAR62591.1 hypothetical protein [Candidatus Margulisiibacteriota bacterium]